MIHETLNEIRNAMTILNLRPSFLLDEKTAGTIALQRTHCTVKYGVLQILATMLNLRPDFFLQRRNRWTATLKLEALYPTM
jgi:hypothetical protein